MCPNKIKGHTNTHAPSCVGNNFEQHFPQTRRSHDRIWQKLVLQLNYSVLEKISEITKLQVCLDWYKDPFNALTKKHSQVYTEHLDYASSVWSPYRVKHIEMLENVQWRCTFQLPYLENLSYEERLKALQLPTWHIRDGGGDMIEVYKVVKGTYDKKKQHPS